MCFCIMYVNFWFQVYSSQVFKNLACVFAFREFLCLDLCAPLCTSLCSDLLLKHNKWYQWESEARWSERLDAVFQKGCTAYTFQSIIPFLSYTKCHNVGGHQLTMPACLQKASLVRRQFFDPLRLIGEGVGTMLPGISDLSDSR